MRVLGIDYGRKKMGLAIADGPLAEPLKVIRYKSEEDVLRKVVEVVEVEKVEQAVVGISEGEMAEETKHFVRKLRKKLNFPIFFQDETLTTKEAEELSIKAGIKRKKRRELEDAYSATLILQRYLDSKVFP
jgi:putative Holliday junction resolvase